MEDKEIIKLYFARNEDAIRLTSEKYGRLCHALSRNILGSEEDAKECVSDAYLAVWNRIPPEEPRSFSAFLTRIVRNISLDRFDYNTAACRNGNADVLLDEIDAFSPIRCRILRKISDWKRRSTDSFPSRRRRQDAFSSDDIISAIPFPILPSATA